jgi:hypothetical protein
MQHWPESYGMLRDLLGQLARTRNPHLESTFLAKSGVDVSMFDMEHATGQKNSYFLPMTRTRLKDLDERPAVGELFLFPAERCCMEDSYELNRAINAQISSYTGCKTWKSDVAPWAMTRHVYRACALFAAKF